jgi:hypothetical protein
VCEGVYDLIRNLRLGGFVAAVNPNFRENPDFLPGERVVKTGFIVAEFYEFREGPFVLYSLSHAK